MIPIYKEKSIEKYEKDVTMMVIPMNGRILA